MRGRQSRVPLCGFSMRKRKIGSAADSAKIDENLCEAPSHLRTQSLFRRWERERAQESVHRRLAAIRLQRRGGGEIAALAVDHDNALPAQPVAFIGELLRQQRLVSARER